MIVIDFVLVTVKVLLIPFVSPSLPADAEGINSPRPGDRLVLDGSLRGLDAWTPKIPVATKSWSASYDVN